MNIKISRDTSKCLGTDCAYKEACLRYVAPANEYQVYTEFFKAGDDCVYYISLPSNHNAP